MGIRRWLNTYDPSYAPWRAELRPYRTMEKAMKVMDLSTLVRLTKQGIAMVLLEH